MAYALRPEQREHERRAEEVGTDEDALSADPVNEHTGDRAEDEHRNDLDRDQAGDRETPTRQLEDEHNERDVIERVPKLDTSCPSHSRKYRGSRITAPYAAPPAARRRITSLRVFQAAVASSFDPASTSVGSRTVTTVPRGSRGARAMEPPWRSTIHFAMASPRPVPAGSSRWASSPR